MTKKINIDTVALTQQKLKKHVAAIHTSGELSLLERKTANVLLLNAYDSLITKRTHSIPVKHLCVMLGWDESNNIERLQDVLIRLTSSSIEFNMMEDGKAAWRVMSMLSYGEIKDGICTYRYDEYLAERFYDPEIYATINIGVQRRFDGGYALTLYENCLRYKSVGSTGWWDLERFRRIMGANAILYNDFRRLNERVISHSVAEVNRVSDIQLVAEFQRKGRKVISVRFLITENPEHSLLKPVIDGDHKVIRESEIFKRLLEHGIGERLAILWILQDEKRAKSVVEYVEEKARQKQIKVSSAGYIRKLYESDAVVGKTIYDKDLYLKSASGKKNEFVIRIESLKKEYLLGLANKAVKRLSYDEKIIWINLFNEEMGIILESYNKENDVFESKLERLRFFSWLRNRLTPELITSDFINWLKFKGVDDAIVEIVTNN